MLVHINIEETQRDEESYDGIIVRMFKKPKKYGVWAVIADVKLTDEERAILTKKLLWDTPIFKATWGKEKRQYIVTLKLFFDGKPFTQDFFDPDEAREFATKLEKNILPGIKQFITGANTTFKPRSFEL